MTRGTPAQMQYFYSTLRAIALDGVLPRDHLLRRCPLDPFEHGVITFFRTLDSKNCSTFRENYQ
jgi:hypothetical protein